MFFPWWYSIFLVGKCLSRWGHHSHHSVALNLVNRSECQDISFHMTRASFLKVISQPDLYLLRKGKKPGRRWMWTWTKGPKKYRFLHFFSRFAKRMCVYFYCSHMFYGLKNSFLAKKNFFCEYRRWFFALCFTRKFSHFFQRKLKLVLGLQNIKVKNRRRTTTVPNDVYPASFFSSTYFSLKIKKFFGPK